MPTTEHGSCNHCGYDLNGNYIWDDFFQKYGDEDEATRVSEMYGASKGSGRWGKAIYFKSYDKNYNKLPSYYKCPECGEKCYERSSV